MIDNQKNAELGQLLIDLARCLLQYVGECWPWTGDHDLAQRTIEELVSRQKEKIGCLAALLNQRRQLVDFGAYPTEFTDLHYLALDHLLQRIIEDEESLIGVLQQAVGDCAEDVEVARLLDQISAGERKNLEQLHEIQARHAVKNES